MIEFRWVALIALWTILIGPVLDRPADATTAQSRNAPARATLKR
jgi:hypothetical protein